MLSYRQCDQLSFVSFQNIELARAYLDILYAAEDEAREQFKGLKENNRKKFDEVVNNALETRFPAEWEASKRISRITLADILK